MAWIDNSDTNKKSVPRVESHVCLNLFLDI